MFRWKSKFKDKKELYNQVKNYKSLNIFQSYRGNLIVLFAICFLLSFFILVNLKAMSIITFAAGTIIYIPLLIFTYKGYKNSFLILGIYFLYDKLYTYITYSSHPSSFSAGMIFFTYLTFYLLYKAWKVLELGEKHGYIAKKRSFLIPFLYLFYIGIIFLALVGTFSKSDSNEISTRSVESSVVNVLCYGDTKDMGGSGYLIHQNGVILTNSHVIPQDIYGRPLVEKCMVVISDPETGAAKEIYNAQPILFPSYSQEYDVALLRIVSAYTDTKGEPYGVYPKSFSVYTEPSRCDDTKLKLGQHITLYGYPSISGGYSLTLTDGLISSFLEDGNILTSAKITHGNSGGIAVTEDGCLVGIPSSTLSDDRETYGVIIPIAKVLELFDKVKESNDPSSEIGTTKNNVNQRSELSCVSESSFGLTSPLKNSADKEVSYVNEKDLGLLFNFNINNYTGQFNTGNMNGNNLSDSTYFKATPTGEDDSKGEFDFELDYPPDNKKMSITFQQNATRFIFRIFLNPPINKVDEIVFLGKCELTK